MTKPGNRRGRCRVCYAFLREDGACTFKCDPTLVRQAKKHERCDGPEGYQIGEWLTRGEVHEAVAKFDRKRGIVRPSTWAKRWRKR